MPMTYDCACKIVLMESKLYALRGAAAPSQFPGIDAQLARIDPYTQTADDMVMKQTDAQFNAVAQSMQAQIKPITDAIADISKISSALTTAAQIINDIVAVVGAVGGLP